MMNRKSFQRKIKLFLFEKFGIMSFWDIIPYGVKSFYFDNIYPIFKPAHSRIRKSIPRKWNDLSSIIVDVNFEILKSFYDEEYSNGNIDWEWNEAHKNFSVWLEKAYKYVNEVRPSLLKQRDDSYPPSIPFDNMFNPILDENGRNVFQMEYDNIPYEKKYAEVIRLENLISDNDTEIILQMIKFREFFWS